MGLLCTRHILHQQVVVLLKLQLFIIVITFYGGKSKCVASLSDLGKDKELFSFRGCWTIIPMPSVP